MRYLLSTCILLLLASPASAQLRISQDTINAFQQQLMEQQIQAELDKLDTNTDGAISRKEFNVKADEVFSSFDTNNDGQVTQAERENARAKILRAPKSLIGTSE